MSDCILLARRIGGVFVIGLAEAYGVPNHQFDWAVRLLTESNQHLAPTRREACDTEPYARVPQSGLIEPSPEVGRE